MVDSDPLDIAGKLIEEKYRIERVIGEGGFAVVYRARHVIWDQAVAVKFFTGLTQVPANQRENLRQAFIQEGALLTELSSLNAGIVQARDVGTYASPDGQWVPFMVLEWLNGSPLDAVLDREQSQGVRWTEEEVLSFLTRILPILEVAHQKGVAHRDIKPANIFVLGDDARSSGSTLKLLDFGVAKMLSEHARTNASLAKTGIAPTSFTPQYGAPEQFTRSHGATGPWTDVYAVALIASEMLVGHPVLQGDDIVQIGFSTGNPKRRPTPLAYGVEISDALQNLLSRALEVNPADRFPNAGEFFAACASATGQRVSFLRALAHGTGGKGGRRSSPDFQPNTGATGRTLEPHHTTADSQPPDESVGPPRHGWLGVLLVIVVVLASGTVVFSATEFPGARETRSRLSKLLHP